MLLEGVKNKFKRDSLTKLFLFIVAGTRGEFGYALAPAEKVAEIANAAPGLLESVAVPAGVTLAEGQTAVKATAAGLAAADANAGTPAVPEAPKENTEFKVETGIEMPASKRGGRTASTVYPFEQLAAPTTVDGKVVRASFLIPNKQKKSLSSTVSAANKRYKDRGMKFAVRDMDGGARVFRIQ